MNKKKLVFLVALLTASYAQAQFTFGVRAGFNLTKVSAPDGRGFENFNPNYKPGFQIGVVGEYDVSDHFAIQPGILFATQGYKVSESITIPKTGKVEVKGTVNINYFQIPVNVLCKADFGGNLLLLQAGPYFGFALGGKAKSETTVEGETEKDETDLKFGSKEDQLKPFDFGLGYGVIVQLDAIQIGLGYNLGLTKLYNIDKMSIKNRGFVVTTTYFFGK